MIEAHIDEVLHYGEINEISLGMLKRDNTRIFICTAPGLLLKHFHVFDVHIFLGLKHFLYNLVTLLEGLFLSKIDFLVFFFLNMHKLTLATILNRRHIDISYALIEF